MTVLDMEAVEVEEQMKRRKGRLHLWKVSTEPTFDHRNRGDAWPVACAVEAKPQGSLGSRSHQIGAV